MQFKIDIDDNLVEKFNDEADRQRVTPSLLLTRAMKLYLHELHARRVRRALEVKDPLEELDYDKSNDGG